MEMLCIGATVLGLLTLIGHGFWLLLARLFRGPRKPHRDYREPHEPCRNCNDSIPVHTRECPGCGMTRNEAAEAGDLRAMKRQLDSFFSAGQLDVQTFNRLLDLIEIRQRALKRLERPKPTFRPVEPREFHAPAPVEQPNEPETSREATLPAVEPVSEARPAVRPGERVPEPSLPEPAPWERAPNIEAPPVEAVRPDPVPAPVLYASPPSPPSTPSTPAPPFAPVVRAAEPGVPARPRVSWGEWLGAFLEQRNIFWGELIGGLLIVGCSIALILSLWRTLETIPLFPFLAAAAVTMSLYGAGRYSLSHWKLESSSRGLLVISTLLVPLTFLVLAGISPRSNNALELAAKIVALTVFALIVRGAGRVLLPDPADGRSRSRGWLFPLAVVGPALAPLLAMRVYDPGGIAWPFALLLALPVVCLVAAVGGAVLAHRRSGSIGSAAAPVLGWVGFAVYSLAVSVAFLVFWVSSQGGLIGTALNWLAGPTVVAGASVLAAGLFVQRRAAAAPSGALGVTATGIALLGGLMQLAAFGMAWPERGALLIVGLANSIFLTAVSFRFRFPPVQMLALPSLLVSLLAGVSLATSAEAPLGDDAGLLGAVLAGLVVVFAITADFLSRTSRQGDALAYRIGAGLLALLSLGLAAADSVVAPQWATLAGSVYAAGCFVLSRRWRIAILEQLGMALLPITSLAALHWGIPAFYPAWGFVLALEALVFSALRGNGWRAAALAALLAVVAGAEPGDFGSGWNTTTLFLLTASALVQAARWRLALLTWTASALLLAGIAHGSLPSAGLPLALPWGTVFLLFTTVGLCASLIGLKRSAYPLRDVFALPLRWAALGVSAMAAANLLSGIDQRLLGPQALGALWLGLLWLVAALAERQAPWFVAFQIATTAAVALGAGYLLTEQARTVGTAVSFASAAAVYSFGLGLGGLAVGWAALRRLLERRRFFRIFYEDPNAFDQYLLGVLVVGQLFLAGWLVLPEVAREIYPVGIVDFNAIFQSGTLLTLAAQPWIVLGLLGAALLLSVRADDPKRRSTLLAGLGCLAVAAPLLAAGRAAPELASASTLRWWLSAACIGVSVPFWLRLRAVEQPASVARLSEQPGPVALRADEHAVGRPDSDSAPEALLSIAIALPVLLLSAASAAVILSGYRPAGPHVESFFAGIGWSASHGFPLAAIALVLLGHAVRDRAARYALATGILATLSAGVGYAVASVLAGALVDEQIIAAGLQRATAMAALVSAAWMGAVTFAFRRAGLPAAAAPPLWSAQQGLAFGGNLLLLGGAALLMAIEVSVPFGPTMPPTYPEASSWGRAAASAWGWVALLLTVGAGLPRYAFVRRQPSTNAIALSILGLIALSACGIAVISPAWGYRALMYGMAAFALVFAGAARRSTCFDNWICITGGIAVCLAAKATLLHGDSLAAVPTLAAVSAAGLWLSLRRERPDWACLAAIVVQLTAATALWHGFRPQPLEAWAAYLVQSVTVVAGLLMLLGRWLHDRGRTGPNAFTQFQQTIVGCGLSALFGVPFLQLVIEPGFALSKFAVHSGELTGLCTLLIVGIALAAFVRRHVRAFLGDVLGGFALLTGIWLALAAAGRWPGWSAIHTLMAAWAMTGAAGLFVKGRKAATWAQVFALLVTALALRSAWDDPLRPYYPAGATVLAAAVYAAVALRERRIAAVWASCGLFNLAGFFLWAAWGAEIVPQLVATQIACLAGSAIIWFALERRFSVSFRETAVAAQALVLALLAAWGLVELTGSLRQVPEGITWIAGGLAVVATILGFLMPSLRLASASLYVLGLSLVVFGLLQPRWPAAEILRPATLALAGYALFAQFVERIRSRRESVCPVSVWFMTAQLIIAGLVILLSLPASFDPAPTLERLAGPLALSILCIAVALLAARTVGPLAQGLEHAVFGLTVLLLAEIGWTWIDPHGTAVWLHGTIALLAALGLVAAAAALLVPRCASPDNRWVRAAQRTGPVLGVFGVGTLAIVLLQEMVLFDPGLGGAPLSMAEAGLVAAAMMGLIAAALAFAVRPGLDPLGLSGAGRQGYVYAAEAVLALMFLHLRLNVPGLLPTQFGGMRWAFTVMLIAFAGVGLAEFFRRRGLEVLADPLHRTGVFLPALPLLAFWLMPGGAPASFRPYSFLWLTVGLLYGVLALNRRSYRYVLGAALAMNAALWALFAHEGIGFLVHPQLWLVPLALIVLASEYFHRDRLAPELASGLRYGGLVMLYIASTADVFIAGPGESAPLLLVLAVLAVVGVLAGILLRVRAYLFLGSGFLALVVFRMIWHAAVEREQTWVWWVCGIVLGVLVLTLFAILERRGQKVRAALERFHQWR